MPQKIVAQARAFAGSLDDAGNVRHDEADPVVHIYHTQIRIKGRKVVVGDFRMCLAHNAE